MWLFQNCDILSPRSPSLTVHYVRTVRYACLSPNLLAILPRSVIFDIVFISGDHAERHVMVRSWSLFDANDLEMNISIILPPSKRSFLRGVTILPFYF